MELLQRVLCLLFSKWDKWSGPCLFGWQTGEEGDCPFSWALWVFVLVSNDRGIQHETTLADDSVGTIITSTAKDLPTFIGGRFLLSFFSTLATTAAPLYLIEIAPPLYRGTVAGLYNTL
jgi:MFS family permease